MARSRKKTPGWCDRSPWWKNYANRRLRRLPPEAIPNGCRYKRHTCSYHICDFKHLYFRQRWVRETVDGYRHGDDWYEGCTPLYKLFIK